MKHLSKLLATSDSDLAWVLRLGLHGLRTQLLVALETSANDSGRESCEELLKEIDVLLKSNIPPSKISPTLPMENNSPWEDILEPIPAAQPEKSSQINTEIQLQSEKIQPGIIKPETIELEELKLEKLKLEKIAHSLICDRDISNYIGEYQICSDNDAQLWDEIQYLLLRVPEKIASIRQKKILKLVGEIGVIENKQNLKQLPFIRTEYLYPGLTGSVNAQGLLLSDQIDFDPRLKLVNSDVENVFLGKLVSICLKFIDTDPCLHHALKSVDRFGVRSLQSESEKSKYIATLIERFQRVQLSSDKRDSITALRAKLDLDEAIHSLVYLPPVERYSWWGKLQQEARRTLDMVVAKAREAGNQVQIRPLWGTYADIYTYSKDDLRLETGGIPGEVSACLRVYAKINDEILPGRVLFRAS
ncbi:hypothetical protein [Mastigocoleus testarum]|uniref:Uncharacterized protein n=1 Tax=Mastigocoleus testarum BC008 TaxID=371196 RepID=A0A0V7ZXI9_9CYAN|nr:hypothetical protein [Mastigocoleus testarum]KST69023.1 hypothetical protein BC008_02860 [Mastigocoleus testarum BC008]